MSWGLIIRDLWLAWFVYWIIRAIGNKATARRERTLSERFYRIPTLMGVILLIVPRWHGHGLSSRFLPSSPVFEGLGVALLVAGLVFSVWARIHLGANWSGIVTVKKDHELIRTGPYAWVRHPIYTGILLGLLGTVIALDEWRGLFAFVLMTIGFVLKLRIEERWLHEIFGEPYALYKREVPALFPGIY
jgi:protein-S-isoprenylcysteine O-methyltransferase Ste14